MTLSVKHAFTNPKGDPADTTIVRPSNWNAEHTLTAAANVLLGRGTGAGAVEEIACTADARTFLAAATKALMRSAIGTFETADITDAAVTLAKMANLASGAFIVRKTASTGVPETGTFGQGLLLNTTTGVVTAPGFAPPSAFKNLSIKVATNTTVTVAADYVSTFDGTNVMTTALSGTVDLATNGAANALDAGTIASATWYAIWAIAKSDGTTAALASTSFTSPTLPSGYTFKARIGAVRTAAGSAQLMGTWQLGRKAQYVVGLAQTTITPLIASGTAGTHSTTSPTLSSVSVSNFVPSTASMIRIVAAAYYKGGAQAYVLVAPSMGYSGSNKGPNGSLGLIWPATVLVTGGADASYAFELLLESTSIAWASNGAGGAIGCFGWEDNL